MSEGQEEERREQGLIVQVEIMKGSRMERRGEGRVRKGTGGERRKKDERGWRT